MSLDRLRGTKVQGVSFDATGTLISCPRLGEIYAEVLQRHGVSLTAEAARSHFHTAWQELDCRESPDQDRWARHPDGARGWWSELIHRVCALAGAEQPSEFAVAELFHRFTQGDAWEVYPDARRLLYRLRQARMPTVVTSNWDRRLHTVLDRVGLLPLLGDVVISQDIGVAKPSTAIFDAARQRLEQQGATAEGPLLHVGDHVVSDFEGAQAAGFRAVLLDRRGHRGTRRPDEVASLDELPRLLGLDEQTG